jgi:Protein of unknown function (DUF1571)
MLSLSSMTVLWFAAAPAGWTTDADRRAFVATASTDQIGLLLTSTPPDVLLTIAERAVTALGTYTYVMAKQERVKGTLIDEQVVNVSARETPFAVRLDYVRGPSSSRKVLYNSKLKAADFAVHEAGFFSFAGTFWLPLDTPLAKSDSNHSVKEAGLGSLVRRLKKEVEKANAAGGLTTTAEGWVGRRFCLLYAMPNGGKGFDAAKTRVCTDFAVGVPVLVESFDAENRVTERFAFSDVAPAELPESVFDPKTM